MDSPLWSTSAARAPKASRWPTCKNADIRDIKVTGYTGPLLGISNVAGKGLDRATKIDPPKVPDPVATQPYQLR